MSMTPVLGSEGAAAAGLTLDKVRSIDGGWLAHLQRRNASHTLTHVIEQLEVSGVLGNLRANGDPGRRHVGFNFSDSDLYKTLEAVGWEIARTGTVEFDSFLDEAVALLSSAQRPDGYLNSWAGSEGAPGPWEDLTWGHELYCGGHLIQAAIALARAERPALLEIARAWADLVTVRFAEAGFCGHPEVETALVELFRQTGERSYLRTAASMIDRRGTGALPPVHFEAPYFQDHAPVREAREAIGHAVRQIYLDAGVADVLAEIGDESLRPALLARWESAHHTKMHLTGALGSRHFDESFGDPYELPPDRAYAETCAAIADFHLNWRLLLATGEARYADAMERLLANAIPAAVSGSGTEFFYSCPLQLRSTHHGEPNAPSHRVAWYPCACCPPNLARLFASLTAYLVTVQGDQLTLQLYGDYRVVLPPEVGDGELQVRWSAGAVTATLSGELKARLRLRVPAWSDFPGDHHELDLADGATLTVDFGATPRFVSAHPQADALRGTVAVMLGETVFCAESVDTPNLEDVAVDQSKGIRIDGDTLIVAGRRRRGTSLYGGTVEWGEAVDIRLHPYRDWGNRGEGAMRVWLPVL